MNDSGPSGLDGASAEGLTPDTANSSDGSIRSFNYQESRTYVGTMPAMPPEMLRGYIELGPEYAEWAMRRWETEASHQNRLENELVKAEVSARSRNAVAAERGQWFGLFIGTLGLTLATVCALNEAQWTGSVIGGGSLAGIVASFLRSRRRPIEADPDIDLVPELDSEEKSNDGNDSCRPSQNENISQE